MVYISNHFYFPPSPNTPTTHPDPDPSPPHPKAATAAPPPRRSPPRGAPPRRRSVPSGISARHLAKRGQNLDRRSMASMGKMVYIHLHVHGWIFNGKLVGKVYNIYIYMIVTWMLWGRFGVFFGSFETEMPALFVNPWTFLEHLL